MKFTFYQVFVIQLANGKIFIQCIKDKTFSTEDVIPKYCVGYGYIKYNKISHTYCTHYEINEDAGILTVKSSFEDWGGRVNHLEIHNDTIVGHDPYSTIEIQFNQTIICEIYIMDRKLQFVFGSPDIIPRPVLTLKANESEETYVYLKAIQHEKLNQLHRPCEESPEYDFSMCLERSIITRAGCQPPWRRFNMEGQPICDNSSLLNKFRMESTKVSHLVKDDIFKETNCLMPCSFMEYRVSVDRSISIVLFYSGF